MKAKFPTLPFPGTGCVLFLSSPSSLAITEKLSEQWKELSEEEQKPFVDAFETENAQYVQTTMAND